MAISRQDLDTDKIFKNKEADWFVRIVYVSKMNVIFQYSKDLDDLLAGRAQEDSGPIDEFVQKFGIYEPPKIPTKITLYRYLIKDTKDNYGLTQWYSVRRDDIEKKDLKAIKEFTMEIETGDK